MELFAAAWLGPAAVFGWRWAGRLVSVVKDEGGRNHASRPSAEEAAG